MLALVLAIFGLCIVGWLVGEATQKPLLSVPCALALMVMIGISAKAIGSLSRSLHGSIEITTSVDRFIDTAVERLDDGQTELVHDELRYVSEHANWTKESGPYIEAMDEATKRLKPDE
jgi:hypothetical protein